MQIQLVFLIVDKRKIAEWLPDRSEKPTAEALCDGFCGEDLQRIAGTNVEQRNFADSPTNHPF